MNKAVAYLRVSGASQLDGDGFDRQIKAITTYASTHGYQLVGTYREEAVPGKTEAANRPAFMAMLAYLLADGVKTVLIERLDRLARDLMVQESIIADFQRKGLTLISVSEPDLLGEDPSRILMRQILGAFFQYEKTLLVAKLKHSRASVRAKGGFAGGNVPYGYTPKRASQAELMRALEESQTKLRIRHLRDQGFTYDAIRQTITSEGRHPRNGQQWQLSTIRQIANGNS